MSTWGSKKAEVNGDAILDTPGDPGLYVNGVFQISEVGGVFIYNAGLRDRWGEAWQPDVYNMMSYGAVLFRTQVGTFTPTQAGIMSYFAQTINTPTAALSITGPSTVCPGTYQFSVLSAPATTYFWSAPPGWSISSQGSSSVVIGVPGGTPAGRYTIAMQPGCGYAFATYDVRVGFPASTVSGPLLVCRTSGAYYEVPAVAGATYQWFAPAGWDIDSPTTNGTYINANSNAIQGTIGVQETVCSTTSTLSKTVRLRNPDANGSCDPVSTPCLLPSCRTAVVAAQPTEAAWAIEVSPNPSSDRIILRTSRAGPANTTLLDSYGRAVRLENWSGASPLEIIVGSLPKGLYWLRVTQGKQQIVKHIELN